VILIRNQLEKRVLIDNLDMVLLTLDEIIDDGVLLETDSGIITSRVTKQAQESSSLPIGDQTLSSVWRQAQEQLTRSFLK
jgi:coatomer subunit zeta